MIRKVTSADKAAYMELTEMFYSSPAVLTPIPAQRREASWNELMRSNVYTECFFAQEGECVLGYMLLSYTFTQEAGGRVVWVEEVFVLPQARGRGIGKQFFEYLRLNLEPTAARVRLEVEPENEAARRLYLSLGYNDLPYQQMMKEPGAKDAL